MPRQSRLDVAGALHHIMVRGINKSDIFEKEVEEKHLRQLKLRQSGLNIAEIIKQACKKRKISAEELRRGSRRRNVSEACAAIAIRSSKELGLSGAETERNPGVNTSSIPKSTI